MIKVEVAIRGKIYLIVDDDKDLKTVVAEKLLAIENEVNSGHGEVRLHLNDTIKTMKVVYRQTIKEDEQKKKTTNSGCVGISES